MHTLPGPGHRAILHPSIPSGAAATKAEQCERTVPCSAGFWGLDGKAPNPKSTYLLAPPASSSLPPQKLTRVDVDDPVGKLTIDLP